MRRGSPLLLPPGARRARASPFTGSFFYKIKEVMEEMAKSKAEKWLEPDGLLRIEGWARDGLTEEQIAKNMGVSRSTLSDYKVKYPDILRHPQTISTEHF